MATENQHPIGLESQAPPSTGTYTAGTSSESPDEWICIASFDGGGPGCVSQLKMMNEFMARVEYDRGMEEGTLLPAECFHVMGGTGWGGYCAILLGRLGMTIAEAQEALITTAVKVFTKDSSKETRLGKLKTAIEDILKSRNLPIDMKLYDPRNQWRCQVVVFAASTNIMGSVQPFRSYRPRRTSSSSCTVIEAACAVMANPKFFTPVSIAYIIGSGKIPLATAAYAGTPLGYNNPIRAVIEETELSFTNIANRKVSLILSFGAGEQDHLSIAPFGYEGVVARYIVDCERVVRELELEPPDATIYLRLSVEKGIGGVDVTEWEADKLGEILAVTAEYLDKPRTYRSIENAIKLLKPAERFIIPKASTAA